jgi:hypothetical protein
MLTNLIRMQYSRKILLALLAYRSKDAGLLCQLLGDWNHLIRRKKTGRLSTEVLDITADRVNAALRRRHGRARRDLFVA